MSNYDEWKEALEWSRHYDNLLWIVTSLLTGANAALMAIAADNKSDFPIQVCVLGMVLTVLTVFFAASFRSIRRRLSDRLERDRPGKYTWLVKGGKKWFRQWPVFVLFFAIVAVLWTTILLAKSPQHRCIWWVVLGASLLLLSALFWFGSDSSEQTRKDCKCGKTEVGSTTTEVNLPSANSTDTSLPPTNKRSSNQHAQKIHMWVTLGVEVIGLIALICYALTTAKMWKEMQQQTRIQRNTSINSERAWIGLDVPITLDAIELQSTKMRIKGHYSTRNFGHGPALKVMQSGNFVIPNASMETQTREANFFCDSSVKFATGTVPVVGSKQPAPFGHTVFPGQGHDEIIDFQGPPETAMHLRFIGCVAYIDQFKTVHWTRFCMERRPGDPTPLDKITKLDFCSMYNDTDRPEDN